MTTPSSARASHAPRPHPAAVTTDRKMAPEDDPDADPHPSWASSPISTHSRASVDTTDMPEDEPLLGQPQYPQYPRVPPQTDEASDPPPQYSPRDTERRRLPPEQLPLCSDARSPTGANAARHGYYTFPHAAPVTPGDGVVRRGGCFSRDSKHRRRRRWCCCPSCAFLSKRRLRKRLLFALCLLGAVVILAVFIWQACTWIHGIYRPVPDLIPWYECPAADVHRTLTFDFTDTESFTLRERLHNEVFLPGALGGKVKIQARDASQWSAVRVSVEMRSSYLTYLQHIEFRKGESEIIITSPNPQHGKDLFGGEAPCTAINVVISVDPALANMLEVDVRRLTGIEIGQDAELSPQHLLLSTAQDGRIARRPSPARFKPHDIDFKTAHGSIDASLPLTPDLWLASVSGNIHSTLTRPSFSFFSAPQQPYAYHANTVSGDLSITFPDAFSSDPEIIAQASTVSGQLGGDFLLGRELNLTSVTGHIQGRVRPYGHQDVWNLVTDNVVGYTDLTVMAARPVDFGPVDPAAQMRSWHQSVGGGMRLTYPSTWTGTAHGRAVFGNVDIAGDGVEETWGDGRNVDVRKGDGESEMYIETVGGMVEVLVG